MPDLLINVLLQAFSFGIGAIGAMIAFRIVRYPDLTADGSFMLGSGSFAFALLEGWGWGGALLLATATGAAAGLFTAFLSARLGVTRLLSGILTTMIAYALAFRLLGGMPNVGLELHATMFGVATGGFAAGHMLAVSALFAGVIAIAVRQLLRSEVGLLLRATGGNPALVSELDRSPHAYRAMGLALANALVALSAALVSAQQGFVDLNLGVGVVITLIAALVLGEELLRRSGARGGRKVTGRVVAPVAGAGLYFLLYFVILRASIEGWLPLTLAPTDLKLLSASLVIAVIALRSRKDREEVFPL